MDHIMMCGSEGCTQVLPLVPSLPQTLGKVRPLSSSPPLQQRLTYTPKYACVRRCWLVSRNHNRLLRCFFFLLCCILNTMLRRNALASCLMAGIQRNIIGLRFNILYRLLLSPWVASLECCLMASHWAAPRWQLLGVSSCSGLCLPLLLQCLRRSLKAACPLPTARTDNIISNCSVLHGHQHL